MVPARLVQRGVAHGLQLFAVIEGEPGGVARHDREVLREAQQHQALQRGQVLAVQRVLGRPLVVDVRQERVAPHVRLQAPGVLRGTRCLRPVIPSLVATVREPPCVLHNLAVAVQNARVAHLSHCKEGCLAMRRVHKPLPGWPCEGAP